MSRTVNNYYKNQYLEGKLNSLIALNYSQKASPRYSQRKTK